MHFFTLLVIFLSSVSVATAQGSFLSSLLASSTSTSATLSSSVAPTNTCTQNTKRDTGFGALVARVASPKKVKIPKSKGGNGCDEEEVSAANNIGGVSTWGIIISAGLVWVAAI